MAQTEILTRYDVVKSGKDGWELKTGGKIVAWRESKTALVDVDLFERHGQDATGAKVLLFVYRETLEFMENDLVTLQKRRKRPPD